MNLADLLIIYFACGAPFVVYQFTAHHKARNAKAILKIIWHICLWPVYAVLLLNARLFAKDGRDETVHDRHIKYLRSEIEQLAFANGSAASIFDFREIFNRYVGLSEAANTVSTNVTDDFFEIAMVENKPLASACVARRNREKLAFHQTSARNDFVDLISDLTIDHSELLQLAIHLAAQVNDQVAVDDLNALSYHPTPPADVSPRQHTQPAHV